MQHADSSLTITRSFYSHRTNNTHKWPESNDPEQSQTADFSNYGAIFKYITIAMEDLDVGVTHL